MAVRSFYRLKRIAPDSLPFKGRARVGMGFKNPLISC
jgi:hypothetical protein